MRASPMLIAALSLNVVLAGALLISHYPRFRGSGAEVDSPPAASAGAPAQDDPAKLVTWARQHGASERLAHGLALVVARAATATTVSDEYWRPGPERAAALREAEYRSLQATRELLLRRPSVAAAQARAEMFAARDRELTVRLGEAMFEYIAPRLESSGGPRSNWPGDPASAFLPAR